MIVVVVAAAAAAAATAAALLAIVPVVIVVVACLVVEAVTAQNPNSCGPNILHHFNPQQSFPWSPCL